MAIILSKAERAVMQSIYDLVGKKSAALVSMEDIMEKVIPIRKLKVKPSAEYLRAIATDATESTQEATAEEAIKMANLVEMRPMDDSGKHKKLFLRKSKSNVTEEAVALLEPKVYQDMPPMRSGFTEYHKPVKYAELPHILDILYMEDYIELTEAVDSGEVKYIIKLLGRGQCWERDEHDRKRGVAVKFAFTLVTPIASFILGLLLRVIFP